MKTTYNGHTTGGLFWPIGLSVLLILAAGVIGLVNKTSKKVKPPQYGICTVDDTIAFTAAGVSELGMQGDIVKFSFPDRDPIYRRMQANEICALEDQLTAVEGLL